MARGPGGGRRADDERRRRLSETFDYVITNPPYSPGSDPFSVSRAALERLPVFRTLSAGQAKKLREAFDRYVDGLADYRAKLDPVRDPSASFDPANPDTIGRLVVIALLAQERVPLAEIRPTYGSGVYALYYMGDHSAYAELTRKETPIYVGKADPNDPVAATPRQQGARLFGRLVDHRKAIAEVEQYAKSRGDEELLRVEDFECRRLVCATNAQLVAERHLISLFRPAWNSETKICFGISKHGDSATTRANNKSPWDVMHPGRAWALESKVKAKMTPDTIRAALAAHFGTYPPMPDQEGFMEYLLDGFRQLGSAPAEVSSSAEDTDEVEQAIEHEKKDEKPGGLSLLDILDS